MYSTCLFCNQSLGRNVVVEAFPVGRRLAFDAARGRLWVVCPRCERWNLTPLEERWEAIEQCERLFRDTRLRVSTEQIGLAKLKEGLVLVRVGAPQRPELAAWRYGDQFGRRRRRELAIGAVGLATGVTALAAGPVIAALTGGSMGAMALTAMGGARLYTRLRVTTRVATDEGHRLALSASDLRGVGLLPGVDGDGWSLSVPHARVDLDLPAFVRWSLRAGMIPRASSTRETTTLTGASALAAARVILPRLNPLGGSARTVRDAVARIDAGGSASRFFAGAAREAGRAGPFDDGWSCVRDLPASLRLALEMAAHEEQERRALDGDLAELERAWRDAESIAAIADDLLMPAAVHDRLQKLRTLRRP